MTAAVVHFRQRRCHKRQAVEIGTKSAITVVVGDWRAYTYNVVIITAPRSCGGRATGHRKDRTPTLRSARARRDQLTTRQCRTNRLPATAATAVDPPPPTSCTTISSTRRVTACSAAAKASYCPGGNCSRRFYHPHGSTCNSGPSRPCRWLCCWPVSMYTFFRYRWFRLYLPVILRKRWSHSDSDVSMWFEAAKVKHCSGKAKQKKNCVTHRKNKYILNII